MSTPNETQLQSEPPATRPKNKILSQEKDVTLREAIQKAKHEQDTERKTRSVSAAREIREIFEALDPDSEIGNPNVDSAINSLTRDLYLAAGEVETRQLMTFEVLARKWAVTWFRIGRRSEQLMADKHPNGQEGLRE